MDIKVKYHENGIDTIKFTEGGNWIDLRAAETVEFKKGEHKVISLGVSMDLPDGYEAYILPRSSTFKNYGLLQTNSQGVVDNSYCGDNDIWGWSVYATRDCVVNKNDRVCQFRIHKTMKSECLSIDIEVVDSLGNTNRGGFGSTGIN